MLGGTPEFDLLERCWTPESTFAGAFGMWLAETFREQGLIVLDAAGRNFHACSARDVLRTAIVDAAVLEEKLLARNAELAARGYSRAGAGYAGSEPALSDR